MSNRIPQAEILKECEANWAELHFETRQREEMDRDPQWILAFVRGARWAEKRLGEKYLGSCEICGRGVYDGQLYHEDSEGVMWHKACGDENGD